MSKREVFNMPQESPEWFAIRSGLVTASHYKAMMAEGEGKMRDGLIYRVAGEIVTEQPEETYSNGYMERGKQQEPEARATYALKAGCDPEPIGFIRWDAGGPSRTGCSPDSLIGKDGMLEIKTAKASILAKLILRAEFPPEHKAQVQGQLMVSGRKWCDLAVYCPKMPLFVIRMQRDETYIRKLMAKLVATNIEIDNLVKRIRARM